VERRNADRWHGLVSDIGAQIASPLTAARNASTLIATGRLIAPACVRCAMVEQARQIGIVSQQLTLCLGRVRQSHERRSSPTR
jgi:hypothetical protein